MSDKVVNLAREVLTNKQNAMAQKSAKHAASYIEKAAEKEDEARQAKMDAAATDPIGDPDTSDNLDPSKPNANKNKKSTYNAFVDKVQRDLDS